MVDGNYENGKNVFLVSAGKKVCVLFVRVEYGGIIKIMTKIYKEMTDIFFFLGIYNMKRTELTC